MDARRCTRSPRLNCESSSIGYTIFFNGIALWALRRAMAPRPSDPKDVVMSNYACPWTPRRILQKLRQPPSRVPRIFGRFAPAEVDIQEPQQQSFAVYDVRSHSGWGRTRKAFSVNSLPNVRCYPANSRAPRARFLDAGFQ